jgi:hypothetical protein
MFDFLYLLRVFETVDVGYPRHYHFFFFFAIIDLKAASSKS